MGSGMGRGVGIGVGVGLGLATLRTGERWKSVQYGKYRRDIGEIWARYWGGTHGRALEEGLGQQEQPRRLRLRQKVVQQAHARGGHHLLHTHLVRSVLRAQTDAPG